MSWKSETRRKVEFMLDVYAAGNIGDANLTAELGEVIDVELGVHATTEFLRSCGELAGSLKPGVYVSTASKHYWVTMERMVPRPVVEAHAKERIEFLCRVIAAREIERGLLG